MQLNVFDVLSSNIESLLNYSTWYYVKYQHTFLWDNMFVHIVITFNDFLVEKYR